MAEEVEVDVAGTVARLITNMEKVIIGKRAQLALAAAAYLCEGHILLEDVPGVAKTMFARALARSVGCTFKRLQCTPDLLPTDVTGVSIFNQKVAEFEFRPGPVFAQTLLADEINRATPRTQAALLEAMAERRVTVDGKTYKLEPPFLVIATQNPVDQEGTFPLPEAQLDRFLFKLLVDYPSAEEEARIVVRYGEGRTGLHPAQMGVVAVANAQEVAGAQAALKAVTLAEPLVDYIVALVRGTRDNGDLVAGASPRAAVLLAGAARARAALAGRDYAIPDDIKSLATAVLRHRMVLSPAAEIEGRQAEAIVADLVQRTPAPR